MSSSDEKHAAVRKAHDELVKAEYAEGSYEMAPAPAQGENAPTSTAEPTTDAQVAQMVSRFLMWKLPENFNPDGGITYKPTGYPHGPVGTNLLDATQAEEMVRYMVAGILTKQIYPQTCNLCEKQIESRDDLDWHGLGNCVEICSRCNGSGEEPHPTENAPVNTVQGAEETKIGRLALIEQVATLRAQLAQRDELLTKIRETISKLPTVTGLSPVRDNDGIILAIRDLQECYRDAATARNFGASYTNAVKDLKAQLKQMAEALEDLLRTSDEMMRNANISMKPKRQSVDEKSMSAEYEAMYQEAREKAEAIVALYREGQPK